MKKSVVVFATILVVHALSFFALSSALYSGGNDDVFLVLLFWTGFSACGAFYLHRVSKKEAWEKASDKVLVFIGYLLALLVVVVGGSVILFFIAASGIRP
ncbi:hypothetical protein EZI54_16130 [Marinobacter halodurans]|uniref:Uncharacterized protein n=1 Tax=Marinobacter halodurans TaxID=2528979 RepID=A0ABY1ZHX4_9GAMM|nr:hypothetical protein [Marinobacter halodurans]TBW52568.1 hypothetical protein EZI54_16130 [Marinobacter halodurans]